MKITVTYENGDTIAYKVKPRHLVRYEEEVGDFQESASSTFKLAHIVSDDARDFRVWLDTVDDISTEGADAAEAGVSEDGGEKVPTE